MDSRKFAAACMGAALSLAVTSLGSIAVAADMTAWKPQPPPSPPPLDIHGFFDVTFANDYMTPRGLPIDGEAGQVEGQVEADDQRPSLIADRPEQRPNELRPTQQT